MVVRLTCGLHLIGNLSSLCWTCRGVSRNDEGMNETEWQRVGRLARARREHLGLVQGDLADYGGPKVSTVGKIERAAQAEFPTRTQHQLENALGWKRGEVRRIRDLDGEEWYRNDAAMREDAERGLIEDDIPDLSAPSPPANAQAPDLSDSDLLAELTYRMKRYAADATRGREDDGRESAAKSEAEGTSAQDAASDMDARERAESTDSEAPGRAPHSRTRSGAKRRRSTQRGGGTAESTTL